VGIFYFASCIQVNKLEDKVGSIQMIKEISEGKAAKVAVVQW
jgi:hypothetical protein